MARVDIEELRRRVGTFGAPAADGEAASEEARPPRRAEPHEEPPSLAFTTPEFVEDPAQRAVLADCHAVLARAQVTTQELRRKLVARGHDDAAVEHGIERCTLAGLLDDPRYAASYVESRIRRGHGAQRLRQDLARRGVDRAVIEAAIAGSAGDGAIGRAAVEAARRKLARVDLEDPSARAKGIRWVLSRGYSGAQADAAVRAVREERHPQP